MYVVCILILWQKIKIVYNNKKTNFIVIHWLLSVICIFTIRLVQLEDYFQNPLFCITINFIYRPLIERHCVWPMYAVFRLFTTLLFYLFLSFRSALPPFFVYSLSLLHHSAVPPPLSVDSLRRRLPLAHSAGVHTSASVLLLDQPHESSDLKPSVRASPRSEREPCRVRVASTPACPQLRSIYRWSRFRVVMSRAVSDSVFISSKVHSLIVIYKGNAWLSQAFGNSPRYHRLVERINNLQSKVCERLTDSGFGRRTRWKTTDDKRESSYYHFPKGLC